MIYKISFKNDFSDFENYVPLDKGYQKPQDYFNDQLVQKQDKESVVLVQKKRTQPYIVVYHPAKKGSARLPWKNGAWIKAHKPWNDMNEDDWINKVNGFIPDLNNNLNDLTAQHNPIQKSLKQNTSPQKKNLAQAVVKSNISPGNLSPMPEFSGLEDLKEMYELAKAIFEKARCNNEVNAYVVGYPILWFGDLYAYKQSKLKILTVGINPSGGEFPNDSFERFPAWENLFSSDKYFEGLNQYFNQDSPYNRSWFDPLAKKISLQDVWNGSYTNEKERNTVLHIDFHTPLATDPIWSGNKKTGTELPKNVKKSLQEPDYFRKLFDFLTPDIVFIGSGQWQIWHNQEPMAQLISTSSEKNSTESQHKIQQLINDLTKEGGSLHPKRKQLQFWSLRGNGKHATFVVTGQYLNHPFGPYSTEKLHPIMKAIKAYYDSNI